MPEYTDIPPCPFCGKYFWIFEEPECGQHPGQVWFVVNHTCSVDIELLQKGGSIETVKEALSMRHTNEKT